MTENKYLPYLCREDAVNEYNSLRNELIESQKQRTSLLNYSLVFIGALFGYLIGDNGLSSSDAFFLIVLTIAPSLFSYSTRCRERRIAHYLKIFLKRLTPWSTLSSNNPSLGFLQRSSTTIIVLILLLDIAFLGLSWPFPFLQSAIFDFKSLSKDQALWIFALFVLALNGYIAWCTAHLPTYEADFTKEFDKFKKDTERSYMEHEERKFHGTTGIPDDSIEIKSFGSWSIYYSKKEKSIFIKTMDYHPFPLKLSKQDIFKILSDIENMTERADKESESPNQ